MFTTPSFESAPQPAAQRQAETESDAFSFVDQSAQGFLQRKRAATVDSGTTQRLVAQREGAPEEEELLQGKFETAQREGLEEEELPLQGKFATIQKQSPEEEELPLQGKFDASNSVQREEEPAAANNTGLSDNLKSGIESLSGHSLDDVQVHYNSSKPAQLNALAYAQGTDIHVAPGQEQHVPHEAWHVVQQAQGRVQPTMQMNEGVPVNDDAGLEHEADVMGAKALGL
jgi:hypothetical protein